jgi:hypothetical protein
MTNQDAIAFVKKNPISIGCAVLSVALGFAIFYRSDAIPAAEEELASKTAVGEKYAANIKASVQLKEQLDAVTAATKEIDVRVIHADAAHIGINSQFFYKLEGDTGVKIIDVRPSTAPVQKPKSGSFVPVGYGLSVQGDISQLLKLLHALESGARYCRVMTASITTASGTGLPRGALTLTLSLELLGTP